MESKPMKKIYLYTRYERFWHWLQAVLIALLLITGFEVHGVYTLLGFKRAVDIHNFLGLSWLVLFAFFVFWIFTTGEWRQYVPTTKKLFEVIVYYAHGIFRGGPHPVKKSPEAKHNPLQRLTYLGLAAALLPIQMLTGLLYYLYHQWHSLGISGLLSLKMLALVHLIIAFLILSFLVIHVYMTTTGHTVFSHIAAMISGWEEVEAGEVQEWETGGIQDK